MKILFVIILVIAGFFVWSHFSRPADPAATRSKAQMGSNKVLNYWLEAARDDRADDMRSVCTAPAKGQSDGTLDAIHEAETDAGAEFDKFTTFGMGGGGAVKAILSASDAGILLHLTIRVGESEGKYWIIGASAD